MIYQPARTETERLLRERIARLQELLELLEREQAWRLEFERTHRLGKKD